jgi:hypothetical protein
MKDEKQITMKNGRPATSGICPVCGTKMFKIGGGSKTISKAKATAVREKPKKSAQKAKSKIKGKTKRR